MLKLNKKLSRQRQANKHPRNNINKIYTEEEIEKIIESTNSKEGPEGFFTISKRKEEYK